MRLRPEAFLSALGLVAPISLGACGTGCPGLTGYVDPMGVNDPGPGVDGAPTPSSQDNNSVSGVADAPPGGAAPGAEPVGFPWAVIGRYASLSDTDPAGIYIGQPNTRVGVRFSGTGLTVTMAGGKDAQRAFFNLEVDGASKDKFSVGGGGAQTVTLARDLEAGEHVVWFTRRNEPLYTGGVQISGAEVAGGALLSPPGVPDRVIEVFGASVEMGWCLDPGPAAEWSDDNQDASRAWTQVAADAVGAQLVNVCISGAGMRWDISGGASLLIPKLWQRVDLSSPTYTWDPTKRRAQVAILDLVGNDWYGTGSTSGAPGAGLRGSDRQAQWQDTALAFIDTLNDAYPDVAVYLMIHAGWSAADRPVVRGMLEGTVTKAAARGRPKVAIIEHDADPAAGANCAGHPTLPACQTMGERAAARLRADLGW